MHTKFFKFLGATLLGVGAASICFAALGHSHKIEKADASVGSYSTSISSYYSSSSTQYSGKQLLGQLHDLITSTHKTYTTYDDNGKNLYQQNTDQWYDASGNKVSGYLRDFYSGVKWPNAWAATAGNTSGGYNREHVWCQSLSIPSGSSTQLWGTTGGGSDMHHLRPTEVRINSTRNNNLYGTVSSRDSYKVYSKLGTNTTYALGGYYNNGVFEPIDSVKGDVARIVFYVYTHYNSYSVSAAFGSYGTTNGSGSSSFFASSELPITNLVSASSASAAWSLLLSWNESDPVDAMEAKRNEQCAIYQGNRNPFIDYPDLAQCCWGSSKWNWSTRAIYGSSSGGSTTTDSVSLNKSSLSLTVGSSSTLTTTASGTVTWSTSNSSVATVSSGTVTAKAAGSATITATCGTAKATCAVTVTSSSSGGSTSGSTYAVVFSTNSSDGTSALTTSNLLSSATSSNTLINSISAATKAYKGKSGLKLGTSSAVGSFTAVPVTAAKTNVQSIKVTSTKYGSDTGTLTLSVNGSSVKTGITVGSDYTYTFSSASSVNSFGIATSAKRAYVGSVTFTVGSSSSGGSTTTDTVSLNKSSLSLVAGNTATLTATASGTVTWSTSNSSVATVSSGTVTAKAAGTATITAKCGTASATCTVTVTAATTYSVSLNKFSLSLTVGDTSTLTATASGTVTWSTSNSSVATVSSGKVTAKAVGTATITATCGTATATCTVTVTAASSSTSYHFNNGTAYKMYFTKSSRSYYFTGAMYRTYYGKTTTTKSSGVSVYFEANGEGQNIYFMSNGVKQYLYIYVSGSYPYFAYSTSVPSTSWVYNSSYSCMTFTINGTLYTYGAYSTYFDAYKVTGTSYRVNFVA